MHIHRIYIGKDELKKERKIKRQGRIDKERKAEEMKLRTRT